VGSPSAHDRIKTCSACELGPEQDFESGVGRKLNDFAFFFAVLVMWLTVLVFLET
jgi:hypothetical protein